MKCSVFKIIFNRFSSLVSYKIQDQEAMIAFCSYTPGKVYLLGFPSMTVLICNQIQLAMGQLHRIADLNEKASAITFDTSESRSLINAMKKPCALLCVRKGISIKLLDPIIWP